MLNMGKTEENINIGKHRDIFSMNRKEKEEYLTTRLLSNYENSTTFMEVIV